MNYRRLIPSGIVISVLGSAGYSWLSDESIHKVLQKEEFKLLSDRDDESWLVLAQQYREAGAVKLGFSRRFSDQKDPGFLNKDFWNSKIKGNSNFDRDLEIAEALKKECALAINLRYKSANGKAYKNVRRWCALNLPDYVLDSLKIQKSYGSCRLWLINSSSKETGRYIWEAAGSALDKLKDMAIKNKTKVNKVEKLRESLKSPKYAEEIKTSCQNSPYKIVELAWWPESDDKNDETGTKTWQVSKEWGNKKHRLARY